MTREQGTGNREQVIGNRLQGTGFGRLYFSLLVSVFFVHLLKFSVVAKYTAIISEFVSYLQLL
ncbi:MAG: hypothetical protein ACK5HC_13195 [Dolichospermum sp.]